MTIDRDPGTGRGGAAALGSGRPAAGGVQRCAAADAAGGGMARRGAWRSRLLFAQGLHPADPAVPRRLPLLHLRPSAAPGGAHLLDRRAGARYRPRRRARRLPRGAVHFGRQAGTALCGGARRAGPARPRDDLVLPRRDGGAGAARDGAVAASQPRRHDPRRHRSAAAGLGVAGHHAGERGRAAAAARRAAFRFARQGPGGAPRDDRRGGRGGGAVHHRHPDRHRRDPARAHRVAAGVARAARPLRAPAGDHHPEFPGQARDPHGAGPRARPRRASVDDRRGAADLRPAR